MNEIEQKVWEVTKPICDDLKIELVEVNYKKEFGETILEVLIDKEDYVSTDDTTLVSEKLSEKLDEIDLIKTAYMLEVSSVGLERVYKENERMNAVGKYVHIDLKDYIPIAKNKVKEIEGYLLSIENDIYILEIMNKTRKMNINIELKQIALLRGAVKF